MRNAVIASGVDATGPQPSVNFSNLCFLVKAWARGVCQCEFTGGTGAAVLEGRVDETMSWITLASFSADSIKEVTFTPFIRLNVPSLDEGAEVSMAIAFD